MRTLISDATIISDLRRFAGQVVIDDDVITDIIEDGQHVVSADREIDAAGCFLLPGIIDSHVHFREPGLTEKADIRSESIAAAAGGVTSFFDMPNTLPQTTTNDALEQKFDIARRNSLVNYSFFFGATDSNVDLLPQLSEHRIPGVKLFMGSSTGDMLVDKRDSVERIFSNCKFPIMAHCEDSTIISQRMEKAKERENTDDPDVAFHPYIRSREACLESSRLAVDIARKHDAHLHIAHISTKEELALIDGKKITGEAVVGHLLFSEEDYKSLGSLIKVNPAIKTIRDRDAIRKAIADGTLQTVSTDHAPHRLEEKQGGCQKAASGMPIIQYSLPSMLSLVDEGIITMERLVELMCHNQARIFSVHNRGFIREGYYADLVLVRRLEEPWVVTKENILSKCGWSPLEGRPFHWRVETTLCNGKEVFGPSGVGNIPSPAMEIEFRR